MPKTIHWCHVIEKLELLLGCSVQAPLKASLMVPQTEQKNLRMASFHLTVHCLTCAAKGIKDTDLLFPLFNQWSIGEPTGTAARIFGTGITSCSVDSDAYIFSFMFKHHSGPTLWRALPNRRAVRQAQADGTV